MLTADEPIQLAGGQPPSANAHPSRPAYKVERTLRVTHSLNYRYRQPVRDVVTRLRLLPPATRGAQRLRDSSFHLAPLPTLCHRHADPFGNELLEVRHQKVWEHLTLVVEMELETAALYTAEGHVVPACLPPDDGLPPEGVEVFRTPTPLTVPDAGLEAAAKTAAARAPGDGASLAWALCRHVYAEMRYASGSTTVHTTAAQAWAAKQGVCQDFAHVLLVLCRLLGLPARYVSGFLPGEGAMHAWVEVLLPAAPGQPGPSDGGWVALDPTHDRWVNERYVAVAVGRDYGDITPTSGTFVGSGPGPLSHRSKVLVEKTTQTPA
jgi:transglutaminase-like putative cysteine protease